MMFAYFARLHDFNYIFPSYRFPLHRIFHVFLFSQYELVNLFIAFRTQLTCLGSIRIDTFTPFARSLSFLQLLIRQKLFLLLFLLSNILFVMSRIQKKLFGICVNGLSFACAVVHYFLSLNPIPSHLPAMQMKH